ncbi:uncharacterized protein J3R85_020541 [Psidium guajava]|nr:uncharacterized protein J3R85_020541 [Psidium guajava]
MDTEASSFETSEMLGTFLASTPLLKEAWRLCSAANEIGCGGFVAEQVGGVGYVAFSGVQELPVLGWDPNCSLLAPLDAAGHQLFAPLKCRYDGEEPVMVHSGVLHLFLHYHSRLDYRSQVRNYDFLKLPLLSLLEKLNFTSPPRVLSTVLVVNFLNILTNSTVK